MKSLFFLHLSSQIEIPAFAGIWRRGRVARQRSAKPSTAVRVRSTPLTNLQVTLGVFFMLNFYEKLIKVEQNLLLMKNESAQHLKESSGYLGFFILILWDTFFRAKTLRRSVENEKIRIISLRYYETRRD